MLHVDAFVCTATEKGRSRLLEPLVGKTFTLYDGLLVLCNVEKQDERLPERVAEATAAEVLRLGQQLKVNQAMLHPFAHLFGDPAAPATSAGP